MLQCKNWRGYETRHGGSCSSEHSLGCAVHQVELRPVKVYKIRHHLVLPEVVYGFGKLAREDEGGWACRQLQFRIEIVLQHEVQRFLHEIGLNGDTRMPSSEEKLTTLEGLAGSTWNLRRAAAIACALSMRLEYIASRYAIFAS